jgi:hypothetical protein
MGMHPHQFARCRPREWMRRGLGVITPKRNRSAALKISSCLFLLTTSQLDTSVRICGSDRTVRLKIGAPRSPIVRVTDPSPAMVFDERQARRRPRD